MRRIRGYKIYYLQQDVIRPGLPPWHRLRFIHARAAMLLQSLAEGYYLTIRASVDASSPVKSYSPIPSLITLSFHFPTQQHHSRTISTNSPPLGSPSKRFINPLTADLHFFHPICCSTLCSGHRDQVSLRRVSLSKPPPPPPQGLRAPCSRLSVPDARLRSPRLARTPSAVSHARDPSHHRTAQGGGTHVFVPPPRGSEWRSRAEFVMKAMKTTKGNVREKKRFHGKLINEILLDRKRG